jgi:hypothetical protein
MNIMKKEEIDGHLMKLLDIDGQEKIINLVNYKSYYDGIKENN